MSIPESPVTAKYNIVEIVLSTTEEFHKISVCDCYFIDWIYVKMFCHNNFIIISLLPQVDKWKFASRVCTGYQTVRNHYSSLVMSHQSTAVTHFLHEFQLIWFIMWLYLFNFALVALILLKMIRFPKRIIMVYRHSNLWTWDPTHDWVYWVIYTVMK